MLDAVGFGLAGAVVIQQNLTPVRFEVPELPARFHAEKEPYRKPEDRKAQRDEDEESFHERPRKLFITTSSELADMPSAAPQAGIQPSAAAGIASRL